MSKIRTPLKNLYFNATVYLNHFARTVEFPVEKVTNLQTRKSPFRFCITSDSISFISYGNF